MDSASGMLPAMTVLGRDLATHRVAIAATLIGLGAVPGCSLRDEGGLDLVGPKSGLGGETGTGGGGGLASGTGGLGGSATGGGATGNGAVGGATPGWGGTEPDAGGTLGEGGATGTGGIDPCTEPEVWCDTEDFVGCAELGTMAHCSACGDACNTGEACTEEPDAGAACTCVTGTRCPPTTGDCVDTEVDENHCGGCDIQCGTNAECTDGSCGCTDDAFPDAHEKQSTELVDCYNYDTDVEHCGDFETQCLQNEVCLSGVCACESPHALCPGDDGSRICADLKHDSNHCSACGVRCPVNAVCQDGECQCQPDTPTVCHATGPNPAGTGDDSGGGEGRSAGEGGQAGGGAGNRGGVLSSGGQSGGGGELGTGGDEPGGGGASGGGGELGGGGVSGAAGGGATIPYDPGICVDTTSDPHACSEDCIDCFVTLGIDALCVDSACACPVGAEICIDPETSNDVCVDKQTDERHCGACGNSCGDAEECWGGECVTSPCDGLCDTATLMDPGRTEKSIGCYELMADQIPYATTPRIVGWSFSEDFALEVQGEPWPDFTNGADHPLGEMRVRGWCIEVTSGIGTIYAPND